MTNIKCNKCLFEFDAEKNIKEKIDGPTSFIQNVVLKRSKPLFKKRGDLDEIDESILTVCPNCKNEFPFFEYRFFGFLSPKSLKIIIILFLLGVTLFAIVVLIQDSL